MSDNKLKKLSDISSRLTALSTADFIEKPIPEISPIDEIKTYIAEHTFDSTKVPEPNSTILFYKGIPLGDKAGLVCITGKAKSRKTVIASAIASSFFMPPESNFLGFHAVMDPISRVLHIDTEQGYRHYYESVMRIFFDAGVKEVPERFKSVYTRDAEIELTIDLIEYLLEELKPAALILDGVTDLVYDINDQKEARKIGKKILQWSTKYSLVVVTVIHTTKTTGYMTGAIGTYLEKKCETSIKVEKDEDKDEYSHVSCHASRNKSFHTFTIVYDEEKTQYTIANEKDVTSKGKGGLKLPDAYPDEIHREILNKVFVVRTRFSDFELKVAIINNLEKVTGDKIGKTMVNKWIQFYNERALLFSDPDGGWLRTDPSGLQPTLFILPPKKGEEANELPPMNTDDLPF